MKEIIALTIVAFWIFYPLGMLMMGVTDSPIIDDSESGSIKEPTSFNPVNFFDGWFKFIKVYFKCMYFVIPSAPEWMSFIVLFLQIASMLTVYLLVRGN